MLEDIEKVKLIKRAIASPEGWTNLAESIISEDNLETSFRKNECHKLFKIIAESSYNPEEWFGILTYELDRHIEYVRANQTRIGGPNQYKKIGIFRATYVVEDI